MSCHVGEATEWLVNELWRRWSDEKVGEWAELIVTVIAELILQRFHHFTYVTTHSPTLPSLYLRDSSFSSPSVASPTSQFFLQPLFRFSYVTSSSAELILQSFRHFTYVTTHSPSLPSLYLRRISFSNPSVALPTSQFILQPFFRFSYVTSSSLNSPGEPPMHSIWGSWWTKRDLNHFFSGFLPFSPDRKFPYTISPHSSLISFFISVQQSL